MIVWDQITPLGCSRAIKRKALGAQVQRDKILHSPGVEENELQIQTSPEHKHVGVQLDFCDGAGGQRVSHRHEAHVLEASGLVGTPISRRKLFDF